MVTYEIRDLNFSYPEQRVSVLNHLDLTIEAGEFVVLCGASGSGKSTLLRQLKTVLAPQGTRSGEILFQGIPLEEIDRRVQSARIGFIGQSPDNQIVTDKVWHELAFGLESLGYDTPTIRQRVAEMASFFGIQAWFYRDVAELSGGQKQILNLASVMVMQPSVLILDEPTGQLDPIAASEFLTVLGKLNRELGTTILLTEHRLEEVFPLASRVLVLDRGRILCAGTPRDIGAALKSAGHAMFLAMPAAMRIWAAVEDDMPCPVTVREGRNWLEERSQRQAMKELPAEVIPTPAQEAVISANDVWFRYEKQHSDVVKGLFFSVRRGEFLAILGGNGTGKSTTMKLLAGLLKPYRGEISVNGRLGVLPQNPQALFVKKSVREDLNEVLLGERGFREKCVEDAARLCRLENLLDRHPYDLSGGEQQRAALAKILLREADILLLDEPTEGLDAEFKQVFADILQELLRRNVTILMVSHDIEFCAQYAHRCALFFDGGILTSAPPRAFFSGNSFYTTAANRISRHILPCAVTVEDVICACGGEAAPITAETPIYLTQRQAVAQSIVQEPKEKRKLDKRTVISVFLILLLIPLTLFAGEHYLSGRKYYVISLLILIECMLPFFLVFESRKPRARELVVIAALCAIGVAGRAVFFMLPQCKPVMAITIVAGVALGGEAGFFVGAATMLVSNIMFSQGPLTPWQMFSMGMVGFLAGILFRKEKRRSKIALCVFGALAAILIYGGIMNPASALTWGGEMNWKIFLTYSASGFPMDCVQAAATSLFLWFGAEPMLEKLERLKIKYGLLE